MGVAGGGGTRCFEVVLSVYSAVVAIFLFSAAGSEKVISILTPELI